jgi:glutamate/aspartate transport system permease protein
MTTIQTYASIILPQVLRVVSPILLTQTIILFQDTSLVYVLSVTDLLGAASKVAQRDGRLVEMYLAVAVVYMVICSTTSQLVAVLKRRYAVPDRH